MTVFINILLQFMKSYLFNVPRIHRILNFLELSIMSKKINRFFVVNLSYRQSYWGGSNWNQKKIWAIICGFCLKIGAKIGRLPYTVFSYHKKHMISYGDLQAVGRFQCHSFLHTKHHKEKSELAQAARFCSMPIMGLKLFW